MTESPISFPPLGDKPWPTVQVYTVGRKQRRVISEVASMLTTDSLSEPDRYAQQARLVCAKLPTQIRKTLIDLERLGDGGLLIQGLDVGPIPATPINPASNVTHTTVMANTTALLISVIAKLVAYRAESWGRICQCIVPTKGDKLRQTSTGSEVCLECHTEQAFNLLTRPDYIALGCLRGDPHAITYLMSARVLQKYLPNWAVEALWEPRFFTRVDQSFIDGGVPDEVRGPIAVFTGLHDDPVLTFDEDLMWSDSTIHQAALEMVKEVWLKHRSGIVLRPGEVLIIDNSRAIHGRSSFHPQFDGGDRWLCRFQALCNLATTRHARRPGSPVIEIPGC